MTENEMGTTGVNPPGIPDTPVVVAPDTPAGVFAAVEDSLHRKFGVDAQVEQLDADETSATFGFTIAGTGYSLMVNVTP